jgi:hypothetical protein
MPLLRIEQAEPFRHVCQDHAEIIYHFPYTTVILWGCPVCGITWTENNAKRFSARTRGRQAF